jgi:hypothetical protein
MSKPARGGAFKLARELELERIVSLQEAATLSSISADSWKRNHREKLVELGPRRLGVRLRHALMLDRKS